MNFGMFIIRPDGNYLDFYNRFCYYLSNARISIIEEKEIQFTSEDILKYFYYKFSDEFMAQYSWSEAFLPVLERQAGIVMSNYSN